MTKEDIKQNLQNLIIEIDELTHVIPEDAFAFNALRVRYELAQQKMMAYQTQLQAIDTIENITIQAAV